MTDIIPRAELGDSLRLRRTALGFTREQMAAGIGLRLRDVHAVELGTAQSSITDSYMVWLAVAESWPTTVREQQLQRARLSERFMGKEQLQGGVPIRSRWTSVESRSPGLKS